jgi:hypothetical protein
MHAPTRHTHTQISRALVFIGVLGGIFLLVTGVIVLLLDWFSNYHLTQTWQQASGAFSGTLLLAAAFLVASLKHYVRILFGSTGLLLLIAFFDSLDGAQDIIPSISIPLWFWAALNISTTIEISRKSDISRVRQRVALSLGLVTIVVYLGTALCYVLVTLFVSPVRVDRHPLSGLGIVLSTLLSWVGGVRSDTTPLRGKVRICDTCGLRNIPERRTCKRCAAQLGSVEIVE